MVIAVTNLKGGVGKTTLSTNISVSFAQRGYKVCIVDTDEQQRSSVKWSEQREDKLAHVAVVTVGSEKLIREVDAISKNYDLVILDGTPQLSKLASSTLLASDLILVPISPSGYDYWSFESFLERYNQAKELKSNLQAYLLLNKFTEQYNVDKEVRAALKEFELPCLKSTIGDRVAYRETIVQGMGVTEHKDKKAKEEFNKLTDEIEQIMKTL